jgi:hypothetical protein
MRRVVIEIEDAKALAFEAEASRRQVPLEQLLIEILEQTHLGDEPQARPQRKRLPKSLGMGWSGSTETAENAGEMKFEPRSWSGARDCEQPAPTCVGIVASGYSNTGALAGEVDIVPPPFR